MIVSHKKLKNNIVRQIKILKSKISIKFLSIIAFSGAAFLFTIAFASNSDPNDPNAAIKDPNNTQIEPADSNESENADPNQPHKQDPNAAEHVAFHEHCSSVLENYVTDQGLVNYARLRRYRLELLGVSSEYERLDPREYQEWPENDKIAFWINAYNIFTLKLIVANYPIKSTAYMRLWYPASSIMHIKDAWTGHYFNIMGKQYSLREIERDMLLDKYKDMRIAYALCYGSMSSPRLLNEPYEGYKLDKQLNAQTKEFLARPDNIDINSDRSTIYLSSFYERYEPHFTKNWAKAQMFRYFEKKFEAVFTFMHTFGPKKLKEALNSMPRNHDVKYKRADWRLNEKEY